MSAPKIKAKRIHVGERSLPLLSGEMHFWRLDPRAWKPVLDRIREMGLEIVSTYVCWDFHQIAPGEYDFFGETDPRRNLTGFLDLLKQEGFWAIIRPGPYVYGEWPNRGVPEEAAGYHRLHPSYLRMERQYMTAVVEALRPYFATAGGPILMLQADNEIDPWPQLFTEPLGLGSRPGIFQEFLRERYGEIEALNRTWGTDYAAFDDARATSRMLPGQPQWMRRALDAARFQHWYVRKAAGWAVSTYRELGVDIPIYLNAYSGQTTQRWGEFETIADLAGPDIYPTAEFERRPEEHRHFLEAVRCTHAVSKLPFIAEFEAGIWHEWLAEVGSLPPNHYRMMCLSALMGGIAGWNWYMLAGRDNWYMSPINEWGRVHPELYSVFRQMVSVFKAIDPTGLVKLGETAVTFDALQRATTRPGQDLLRALYQADVDYEFFDLGKAKCSKPLLFYAGGEWLAKEGQQRLLEYVENGGHLVLLGETPYLDDALEPLNVLGIAQADGMVNGIGPGKYALAVEWSGKRTEGEFSWHAQYGDTPGDPIYAERLPVSHAGAGEDLRIQANASAGARYKVGYTEQHGRGRLTVLGMPPSAELVRWIHRCAGTALPAASRTPGISTAVYRRGRDLYLFVINQGREARAAEIELDPGIVEAGMVQVEDLIQGTCKKINVEDAWILTVNLTAKDGTVVRMSPASGPGRPVKPLWREA